MLKNKLFRKICQNYSLKRFPEAASQNCSPKYLSKAVAPNGYASNLCSPKLLPKAAPQNCILKLLPKGAPHSKLLFKVAPPQSCSEQMLSLPRKVVSENGFPKLLSKTIPQSHRSQSNCSSMLLSKPQNCSPQLLPKTALQNYYRSPKFQCCYPKLPQSWSEKLSKAAPQSCCPKLFPGAAPQSCAPKLFSKAVALKLPVRPKWLPKAILQSGS